MQPPGYMPAYLPPPQPVRSGLTFEANLGLGLVWASADGMTSDAESALAGLDLGLGGWLSQRVALSARIAGASFSPAEGVRFTTAFLGPSLQFWTDQHFWLGGGIGLGVIALDIDGVGSDSETGLGLDLRAGYTFSASSDHTFNVSVELTPSFFSVDAGDASEVTLKALGFLVGYQHL